MFSITHSLDRIGSSGRHFLAFVAVNIVAVYCVASGTVLVLLARSIDMPPALVGLIMSFLPLASTLVIFTNPLIERYGPRELMKRTWIIRNILVGLIFFLPLAIHIGGNPMGWLILCVATLGFSVTRAIGMGGWFPWLHEIIPSHSRGLYFSIEQSILQSMNIVVTFIVALWLGSNPSINRFLVVVGVGITTGLLSEIMIARIPGGARMSTAGRSARESFAEYHLVLADKRFLSFIALCAFGVCAQGWMGAASILYLRDVLHYSSDFILFISAMTALGIALTIRRWGSFSDRYGSGRTMSLCLGGSSIVAMGWFLLIPMAPWSRYLVWPVSILMGVFGAAFWAACNRAMLCNVDPGNRVPYTNAWVVGRALAMGTTPIIAGQLIQHFHLAGYMACFCLSAIMSVAGAIAILRLRDDARLPVSFRTLFACRARPLRVLWQIGGIMFGPSDYPVAEEAAEELDEAPEVPAETAGVDVACSPVKEALPE